MRSKIKTLFVATFVAFAAISLLAEDLQSPWKHQDIGTSQVPGTAGQSEGGFTLQGTRDIWGEADGCHFAWRPCRGDIEIVARVRIIENPGKVGHAKASLCIRESLGPGARNVTMCVTPVDGTQFLYREKADGKTVRIFPEPETQKDAVPKAQFPCWLKLIRHGDEFSGYESLDGEKWLRAAQIKLDLPADTVVGLAASSHKADMLTKAVFDRVKVMEKAKGDDGGKTKGDTSGKPKGGATGSGKGHFAQLVTIAIDGADKRVVYTGSGFEAPN
jgi:hypothetical protein